MKFVALAIVALVCLVPADALAEEIEITRADLAISLLRFEQALGDVELDGPAMAKTNRAFDIATLSFFQRKFGKAIREIDAIAIGLRDDVDPETATNVSSLRMALLPSVLVKDDAARNQVKVRALYETDGNATGFKAQLVVLNEAGDEVRDAIIDLKKSDEGLPAVEGPASFLDLDTLPAGLYTFAARAGAGLVISTRFSVVESSLDEVRAANTERLLALNVDDALLDAKAAVAARNELLADTHDADNTAQLMSNPATLSAEVAVDITALAGGTNPFKNRRGDYWTHVQSDVADIPVRVYLPDSADTSKPLSLLIAFHGAGGDENMFMDAYGAGAIKAVAEKHGLLLVSPLTYAFAGKQIGEQYDRLMEVISANYTIDADRIFAVGHSMGGGATSALIGARGDKLAAAACLCGFRGLATDATVPPTLVIAAELDPIVNPSRIEPAAKASIEAGHPIEYRLLPNFGHTVIVGEIIEEAVDWMLENAGA